MDRVKGTIAPILIIRRQRSATNANSLGPLIKVSLTDIVGSISTVGKGGLHADLGLKPPLYVAGARE